MERSPAFDCGVPPLRRECEEQLAKMEKELENTMLPSSLSCFSAVTRRCNVINTD